MAERRIETPKDYYSDPEVARAIIRHLGGVESSVKPSLLRAEEDLRRVLPEYLTVSSLSIKSQKSGVPVRSIKPWELPKELRRGDSLAEIFRSIWSKDAEKKNTLPGLDISPSSQILAWDVEYYNQQFPGLPFIDQRGVFEAMEGAYQEVQKIFDSYGIYHMVVMTGRGYHFLTQVPANSPAMRGLIKIGNSIEQSVADLQKHIPWFSKRDRPVPPNTELAYKGANYLMQYLFCQAINGARRKSSLPVEISDRGEEGISFDETGLVRHAGTGKMGVLGSIYLKPLVKEGYHVENTRLLTRVVRSVNGKEIDGVPRLVQVRQNFQLSADNLAKSGGSIPDGSSGVSRLIKDYERSGLRQLHLVLDNNPGDPPEQWDNTYRKDRYAWIRDIEAGLYNMVMNANPTLLQPDALNYFINRMYEEMGNDLSVAGHVRTLLRSIYEYDFNWGKQFSRHESATRHASGWTAIILGQRFEKR